MIVGAGEGEEQNEECGEVWVSEHGVVLGSRLRGRLVWARCVLGRCSRRGFGWFRGRFGGVMFGLWVVVCSMFGGEDLSWESVKSVRDSIGDGVLCRANLGSSNGKMSSSFR